jgi:hypothetical protein
VGGGGEHRSWAQVVEGAGGGGERRTVGGGRWCGVVVYGRERRGRSADEMSVEDR